MFFFRACVCLCCMRIKHINVYGIKEGGVWDGRGMEVTIYWQIQMDGSKSCGDSFCCWFRLVLSTNPRRRMEELLFRPIALYMSWIRGGHDSTCLELASCLLELKFRSSGRLALASVAAKKIPLCPVRREERSEARFKQENTKAVWKAKDKCEREIQLELECCCFDGSGRGSGSGVNE